MCFLQTLAAVDSQGIENLEGQGTKTLFGLPSYKIGLKWNSMIRNFRVCTNKGDSSSTKSTSVTRKEVETNATCRGNTCLDDNQLQFDNQNGADKGDGDLGVREHWKEPKKV